MSTPQGDQPFGGYRDWPQQEAQQAKGPSRSPLYFLIFAGVALIISLAVVFYVKVLSTTAGAARSDETQAPATTSAAPASPSETPTETENPAEAARSAVADLASSPTCDTPSDAAQSILTLTKASNSDEDQKLAKEALTALSKECDPEFTVNLRDAFSSADMPDSLAKLVSSDEWVNLAKPAPDDAQDVKEFTSPAENIRCQFGDDDVACSIYVYDYPSPDGCEGKTATYRVNATGDVNADCKEELGATKVMDYDTSVSHNGFACTIAQYDGTTCWNELTGKGFQIKRAEDRTF